MCNLSSCIWFWLMLCAALLLFMRQILSICEWDLYWAYIFRSALLFILFCFSIFFSVVSQIVGNIVAMQHWHISGRIHSEKALINMLQYAFIIIELATKSPSWTIETDGDGCDSGSLSRIQFFSLILHYQRYFSMDTHQLDVFSAFLNEFLLFVLL